MTVGGELFNEAIRKKEKEFHDALEEARQAHELTDGAMALGSRELRA